MGKGGAWMKAVVGGALLALVALSHAAAVLPTRIAARSSYEIASRNVFAYDGALAAELLFKLPASLRSQHRLLYRLSVPFSAVAAICVAFKPGEGAPVAITTGLQGTTQTLQVLAASTACSSMADVGSRAASPADLQLLLEQPAQMAAAEGGFLLLCCAASTSTCTMYRLGQPCTYGRCQGQPSLDVVHAAAAGPSLLNARTLRLAREVFRHHSDLLRSNITDSARATFLQWQLANGIEYDTPEAVARAFQAFTDNIEDVAALTEEPGLTYVPGLTKFSDMSKDEFRDRVLSTGIIPTPRAGSKRPAPIVSMSQTPLGQHVGRRLASLAPAVDWRAAGKVTPVKNQGLCGVCWAFTGTAVLESRMMIAYNVTLDLSEQQMTSCPTCECYLNVLSEANICPGNSKCGCQGGPNSLVFLTATTKPIVEETYYPYLNGGSGTTRACQATTTAPRAVVVKEFADYYSQLGDPINKRTLMALLSEGPIAVPINAAPLQGFTSGMLKGSACASTSPNHAVTFVGYDADKGFWLAKNSWGTDWGEAGYFKIAMEDTADGPCGVYKGASFPTNFGWASNTSPPPPPPSPPLAAMLTSPFQLRQPRLGGSVCATVCTDTSLCALPAGKPASYRTVFFDTTCTSSANVWRAVPQALDAYWIVNAASQLCLTVDTSEAFSTRTQVKQYQVYASTCQAGAAAPYPQHFKLTPDTSQFSVSAFTLDSLIPDASLGQATCLTSCYGRYDRCKQGVPLGGLPAVLQYCFAKNPMFYSLDAGMSLQLMPVLAKPPAPPPARARAPPPRKPPPASPPPSPPPPSRRRRPPRPR